MDNLIESGLNLILFIQQLSPALDGLMKVITFLGSVEFIILIFPLIYFVFDRNLGLRVLFILVATDVSSNIFKLLLHQPRPYWINIKINAIETQPSYALPSSHASNTLAVLGYIAYTLRKTWVWVVTILILLLIGISRLYLGVHFAHDVILGWLIGLVVLVIFIWVEKPVAAWWNRQNLSSQISLGFALSMLVILLGVAVRWIISGSPDPESWASFAVEARGLRFFLTDAGTLFGAVSGMALMQRYANFRIDGAWWQRLLRYVLALVGVLVLYLGLDLLFSMVAVDETLAGYVLRYIRYGLVTFWAIFLAPLVFIKIKLAKTEN